jgi:hypothetical protein
MDSFAELEKWLKEYPDQVVGLPQAICEAGEPYVEFTEAALARPDDVKAIERIVAQRMHRQLSSYLGSRKGRLYVRLPFEYEIDEQEVVIRFDENGPDKDFLTDRKCHLDKNWRRVACYFRCYKANHPLNK